mmetsp:Transcript_107471/g.342588  ORF Transcript_107471/g.342588 Transcript_107471/m.342588 type:complete len:260 (-) Transcript_107471:2413-3192(-)
MRLLQLLVLVLVLVLLLLRRLEERLLTFEVHQHGGERPAAVVVVATPLSQRGATDRPHGSRGQSGRPALFHPRVCCWKAVATRLGRRSEAAPVVGRQLRGVGPQHDVVGLGAAVQARALRLLRGILVAQAQQTLQLCRASGSVRQRSRHQQLFDAARFRQSQRCLTAGLQLQQPAVQPAVPPTIRQQRNDKLLEEGRVVRKEEQMQLVARILGVMLELFLLAQLRPFLDVLETFELRRAVQERIQRLEDLRKRVVHLHL